MSNSIKIILSIGSNVNQMENVLYAKSLLKCLLDNIHFTEMIWTEPIGIVSDKYVNCMAEAMTAMHLDKLQFELKKIEQLCGRQPEDKERGTVHMDIDILKYGDKRLHLKDWERPYVKQLMVLL